MHDYVKGIIPCLKNIFAAKNAKKQDDFYYLRPLRQMFLNVFYRIKT